MSIRIQKSKCAGCGRCIEACPGNLIKKDKENKAFIRQVRDCWGCTSCIKECRHDAIRFSLELMWEAEVQVWLYQRNRIFPHGQWRSRMALRLLFRLIRKTLINIKHKYVLSESLECV